jgi:transcriptional regulator with XRE-family HTH domain
MKKLADRVRERMAFLEIEEDDLAKKCGKTQPTINRLLNGLTEDPPYIYELSVALVTSVQWLKTGVEDKSLEFMLQYKPFIDAFEAAPENIRNGIRMQLGLTPHNGDAAKKRDRSQKTA